MELYVFDQRDDTLGPGAALMKLSCMAPDAVQNREMRTEMSQVRKVLTLAVQRERNGERES